MELYLDYKKVGEINNYVLSEHSAITPAYSIGFFPPISYSRGSSWFTLSIIIDCADSPADKISFILNKISEVEPIHIALVDTDSANAYITHMWMTKGDTSGVLEFRGPQSLKEELLWLKKIELMAFW